MRPSRLTLLGLGLGLALAAAGCGGGGGKSGGSGSAITGPTGEPVTFQRASIAADPQTIAAGGSSTITVTATNASGQPVEGVSVALTTTAGTLTPASGQTGADGAFRATLRTSSTATVEATLAGGFTKVGVIVFVR